MSGGIGAERLRATGQPVPATRGGPVRCVLESLALGHRRVLRRAAEFEPPVPV